MSSTNSAPPATASDNDTSCLRRIDDSFYTDLKDMNGTIHVGKIASDIIGTDCFVKQNTIPLPSQEEVHVSAASLRNACIRNIELVIPRSSGANLNTCLKLFWGMQITFGGEPILRMSNADILLMHAIQPSLLSEDAENYYMTILSLLDWPLFMSQFHPITFHAIYKESVAPLSLRVTYRDIGVELARNLNHQYPDTMISTPFLNSLTKYEKNKSRIISRPVYRDGAEELPTHYELKIPVHPRTTSVFIHDRYRDLQLEGAEAICCGVKLDIRHHTARICSITFDPEQANKPLTPLRNYTHVVDSSETLQYITIRSPKSINILADLRFTQANMLTTTSGMTCARYNKPKRSDV
jgi:hypothetical protein